MTELQKHGRLDCRDCFNSPDATIKPHPKWKLRNDPGSWGSRNPRIMVVGFSKGSTQSDIYQSGNFDDVAFGGQETRRNLTDILRRVKLLSPLETSDQKIKETEQEFYFTSLVRCSCARIDEKESLEKGREVYKTSGELMVKSFKEIPWIISNCTQKYLSSIPSSVDLVCLLGVTDPYIRQCRNLFRFLYPDGFKEIDAVTYRTKNFLCVHLTHPSKGNGTIKAWLNADTRNPSESSRKKASAIKREMAINSITTNGLARI
ncbi:hypothetical protein HW932_01820 [Allochromatium humboldtianum]|uniref:Uncharacterized protein n=1 Tax=Allochromatium humboldtianum TaxID=504901 RepID=A0A850R6I3_9GAMM|nr:hypothetical protein [Allochromatium humboldtianum]NVZ07996.1 hypothetical protein [Allochromatium humboldtianum]